MDVLSALNDEQRTAVLHFDTPLIIVAGPGTGKTKTLTAKIEYLLNKKRVAPKKILALTFTKKAAEEMKARVNGERLPFIGTFHAWAYQMLQEQGRNIQLITEEEQKKIFRQLKTDHYSPRQIALLITREKSQGHSTHELVQRYNDELRIRGQIDYDDMLAEALELLIKTPAPRYDFIFIDEFQDTNNVQYALLNALAHQRAHVCVIGDPLQSIYGFRGASAEGFLHFKRDYPTHREITLTKNYRSGSLLIKTSQALFPDTPPLHAQLSHESRVSHIMTVNEYTEADWIIAEISQRMGGLDLNQTSDPRVAHDRQLRFSDFAIVYRTHRLARVLEEKFLKSGIPFQVIGKNPAAYEHETFAIDGDKVIILTMHAAKGLEFPYVFICGFEDGLIPHIRHGQTEPEDVAEERRLLYVAMTRA